MKAKPKNCIHPDCFHCPYDDCKWDGNADLYKYNHSEKGKAAQKRYAISDKGKERDRRKMEKRIESRKNAEYCRRYYKRHREEILWKKRMKRQEGKLCMSS